MCGIIFARSTSPEVTKDLVGYQYDIQKSRGHEGFGFAYLAKDGKVKMEKAETEKEIFEKLDKVSSKLILFHHRLPTSTKNVESAAHPFRLSYKNKVYFFVHNGVIRNAEELKEEHDKLHLHYSSLQEDGKFNDSEALAWDFVLYRHKVQKDMNALGTVAFVCIEADKHNHPLNVYMYHNYGNPLTMSIQNSFLMVASEGSSIEVEKNKLFCTDVFSGRVKSSEDLTIPSSQYYGENYGQQERWWEKKDEPTINKNKLVTPLLKAGEPTEKAAKNLGSFSVCPVCGENYLEYNSQKCMLCNNIVCGDCLNSVTYADEKFLECTDCASALDLYGNRELDAVSTRVKEEVEESIGGFEPRNVII